MKTVKGRNDREGAPAANDEASRQAIADCLVLGRALCDALARVKHWPASTDGVKYFTPKVTAGIDFLAHLLVGELEVAGGEAGRLSRKGRAAIVTVEEDGLDVTETARLLDTGEVTVTWARA